MRFYNKDSRSILFVHVDLVNGCLMLVNESNYKLLTVRKRNSWSLVKETDQSVCYILGT